MVEGTRQLQEVYTLSWEAGGFSCPTTCRRVRRDRRDQRKKSEIHFYKWWSLKLFKNLCKNAFKCNHSTSRVEWTSRLIPILVHFLMCNFVVVFFLIYSISDYLLMLWSPIVMSDLCSPWEVINKMTVEFTVKFIVDCCDFLLNCHC